MPRILIDNRQRKKRLNLPEISRVTSRVLSIMDEKKAELSIVFTNNRAIAILNRKYLSSPHPTDVLAFPTNSLSPFWGEGEGIPYLLGDVVISVEKASSQASRWGEPFEKELIRLIIHGILHLIGYRDKQKNDRRKMFNVQEKILSRVYETP